MGRFEDTGMTVVDSETETCRYCATPLPIYDEGIEVPVYMMFERGEGYLSCAKHWWTAWHGADAENVSEIGGVHTIYAPVKKLVRT